MLLGPSPRARTCVEMCVATYAPRAAVRRVPTSKITPEWIRGVATKFANGVPMPQGVGNRAPMRDLKGWLARLVAVDVLPRWVEAVSALCLDLNSSDELRLRAEAFIRTVLRIILERDRPRSQSIDTTLRRQCCTDARKSGLTFMKILYAICAALDFSGSTSQCGAPLQIVSASRATLWLTRFEYLVESLRAVRLCVKNDDASTQLMRNIMDKRWARTFASLLLKEHHSYCSVEPAASFSTVCLSQGNAEDEIMSLRYALDKAVIDAAPHALTLPSVNRANFSTTEENDPLCCAALLMAFNPQLALKLVDHAIGLDSRTFTGYGIPLEVHREMRIYDRVEKILKDRDSIVRVMMSFSKVFKFNKPPLRWWPNESEMQLVTDLAGRSNAVAITVWGLMVEHLAETQKGRRAKQDKVRAFKMYEKSADKGDLYGMMHVAKLCLEGTKGVERDLKRAETLFRQGARSNVRVAVSHLGDLYGGAGEPYVRRNEKESVRLYQVAVDGGCFRAAYGLADLYERGAGGLPRDYLKAKELRQFAFKKEERKQRQYVSKPTVKPSTPVPDPTDLIRMADASSMSSTAEGAEDNATSSFSLPVHTGVMLPRPEFNDDSFIGSNHRLASEVETTTSVTMEIMEAAPLGTSELSSGWDIPVPKRARTRTNSDVVEMVWR